MKKNFFKLLVEFPYCSVTGDTTIMRQTVILVILDYNLIFEKTAISSIREQLYIFLSTLSSHLVTMGSIS